MSSLSVPFTLFDYFSYLIAGFVLLLSADYSLCGLSHVTAFEVKTGWIWLAVFLIIAYVLGHAIAGVASPLLQRGVVDRWPGRPCEHLLTSAPESAPAKSRRAWREYHTPLAKPVQDAVRKAAQKAIGADEPPLDTGAIFNISDACVRKDADSYAFIERCASLFSFCRNLSVALLASAILFAWGGYFHTVAQNQDKSGPLVAGWLLITVAFVGSVALFFRYLKFYRLHAATVFYSFALADQSDDESSKTPTEQRIAADVRLHMRP